MTLPRTLATYAMTAIISGLAFNALIPAIVTVIGGFR